MAEKVVYIKAPKRERAEKIDLDVFFDSALAAAAIAIIYFIGWPLAQKFLKGEIKLPDLSNLKFPVLGSQLPRNTGNGGSTPSTTIDNTPTTGTWYKANGPTAAMPNARCSSGKCGTGGGGNSGGNRWENEQKGWMAKGFEVVVYFEIPQGAMCGGGHIGLKHGGPNHTSPCDYSYSGSCCCWWDTGIDNDKQAAYVEIERPHPHNLNRKYFKNIGTRLDSGKPIGVRWHIMREGNGFRLIQWIDTSGQAGANKWVETYNVLDTGQFMPTDYYSHITNTQNIEIRISDVVCKDVKMLQGPISRQII